MQAPMRAATFAADGMHERLVKSESFGGGGRNLMKALRDAFHAVESEFLGIAGREGLRDGTTAVVVLVRRGVVACGWWPGWGLGGGRRNGGTATHTVRFSGTGYMLWLL